ncbi:REP-associated tyrosine transposase [Desulfobacca acetoxidans]
MPKDKSAADFFPKVTSFTATRRKLPHWQNPGSVYFITWRCKNPQELSNAERTITLESIRFWDRQHWLLFAAVIMPDHVHLLAQPMATPDDEYTNLGKIIKSIKSYSARQINRLRDQQGSVWQPERYDRIVRNDAEFLEKWQYIRNNPIKAGLAVHPEDYPWLYESINPIW